MKQTWSRYGWLGVGVMALVLAALQPGEAAGTVITRRTAGLPPPLSAVDLQLSLELGPLVAADYTFTRVYATVTNLGPARAENATVTFARRARVASTTWSAIASGTIARRIAVHF